MYEFNIGSLWSQLGAKLMDLNWALIFFITLIASVGFVMLYSAAGGDLSPWAKAQIMRFCLGLFLLFFIALIDIRVWMELAYPAYGVAFILLIAVLLVGDVGKGAQRWLLIGPINIQPSELMKITMILALARYFHGLTTAQVSNPINLIIPLLLICTPVALVLQQPDLGTSLLLFAGGALIVFLAGIHWFYVGGAAALAAISAPIAWGLMHDYQKQRVLTFLNPTEDRLGSGYHIIQAKIALGSGGLWGKGYMNGTQSHLEFLPERHTDFIFTMLAEEFGLVGAVGLIALYIFVLAYGILIAMSSRNHFGRLVAMGVTITFFFYIIINTAMVMGLIPVVGVPLPLVSYGGTSMLTLMIGFGLLMSVHVHRFVEVPRRSASLW